MERDMEIEETRKRLKKSNEKEKKELRQRQDKGTEVNSERVGNTLECAC